jgi:hypothetical protein
MQQAMQEVHDLVVDAKLDYRGSPGKSNILQKVAEEEARARKHAEEDSLARKIYKDVQKKAEGEALIKSEKALHLTKAEETEEAALARKKAELEALLKKHEFLQIWKHQILLRRFQNALSRLRALVQDLPSIPSLCAEKEAMTRKKAELEAFMKKHEILQIWKHQILFRRFHSTVDFMAHALTSISAVSPKAEVSATTKAWFGIPYEHLCNKEIPDVASGRLPSVGGGRTSDVRSLQY